MIPRPPRSTRTDTLVHDTSRFRSFGVDAELDAVNGAAHEFVLDGSESIILRIGAGRPKPLSVSAEIHCQRDSPIAVPIEHARSRVGRRDRKSTRLNSSH